MSSTYKGTGLFNSGPHRFALAAVGRSVTFFPPPAFDSGKRELIIRQTGRLIGTSESDLWNQIDAIRTEAENASPGTLIDHHGNTWTNMVLYRFEPTGPPDRGRDLSQPYSAEYIRYV